MAWRWARKTCAITTSCALDALLVRVFVEAHAAPPDSVVLDLDPTDLPLYGHQEVLLFHGCYDEYRYLPPSIFAGGQLLCARLRQAKGNPQSRSNSSKQGGASTPGVEPGGSRLRRMKRTASPAVAIAIAPSGIVVSQMRAAPRGSIRIFSP